MGSGSVILGRVYRRHCGEACGSVSIRDSYCSERWGAAQAASLPEDCRTCMVCLNEYCEDCAPGQTEVVALGSRTW